MSGIARKLMGGPPVSGRWNISTAEYVQSSPSLPATRNNWDLWFSPDGLWMYLNYNGPTSSDNVTTQYSLSTAWDVSTLVFVREVNFSTTFSTIPIGLYLTDDGSNLFFYGSNSVVPADCKVVHVSLSTPFNISTWSFVRSLSLGDEGEAARSVRFSPDGLNMFTNSGTTDRISRRQLSTPFNISTVAATTTFSYAAITSGNAPGTFFKPDGKAFYQTDITNDFIVEFSMDTPWDITSASVRRSFNVLPFDGAIRAMWIDATGSRLYASGGATRTILQFELG